MIFSHKRLCLIHHYLDSKFPRDTKLRSRLGWWLLRIYIGYFQIPMLSLYNVWPFIKPQTFLINNFTQTLSNSLKASLNSAVWIWSKSSVSYIITRCLKKAFLFLSFHSGWIINFSPAWLASPAKLSFKAAVLWGNTSDSGPDLWCSDVSCSVCWLSSAYSGCLLSYHLGTHVKFFWIIKQLYKSRRSKI